MQKIPVANLEGVTLSDTVIKDCRARLIAAEKKMLYIHRHCKGDASETGLVQFAQAVQDLDETRGKYPTYTYKDAADKDVECLIPFSSDIKFNLFIRDMNKDVSDGANIDDNLCVFMKGAPERILSRCTKMLVEGEEVDFTDDLKTEVNNANSDFGKLGERVLAFARYRLPSDKYKKGEYKFDVKTWKNWGLNANLHTDDY
jgi:sodium/potassium-transporting ATPase subunit alpha